MNLNGLAGLTTLHPEEFPRQWAADGVYAHIEGPGQLNFPMVPACFFVMDLELEFHNKDGLFYVDLGEPGIHARLQFGPFGQEDAGKDTITCRMLNWRPGPMYWVLGHKEFEVNRRISLQLRASGMNRFLFHEGECVRECDAWPTDLTLHIVAETPLTKVTIHRLALRPWQAQDAKNLPGPPPPLNLPFDPGQTAARLQSRQEKLAKEPTSGKAFVPPATGMPLGWIPEGEFDMGSTDPARQKDERSHRVRLTRGFWMSQYETTQKEWAQVMGYNPSRVRGSPFLPVDWVSWEEALRFCGKVTESERRAGRVPQGYEYRLPTEAEWEYACRAGSNDDFSAPDFWHRDNSEGRPHEVGEKAPNAWGLYDMHGNVWEWCLDKWHPYPKAGAGPKNDPVMLGRPGADEFLLRGGSWFWRGQEPCRSSARERNRSVAGGFRGFRMVLAPAVDWAKGVIP